MVAADAVFVPGLDDSFLPGAKRAPYAGLVLESARLLFVFLSRARAVCIVSFARSRRFHGSYQAQTPCRFCVSLGGTFQARDTGLTDAEVAAVNAVAANL